jgi:hypothetical protein
MQPPPPPPDAKELAAAIEAAQAGLRAAEAAQAAQDGAGAAAAAAGQAAGASARAAGVTVQNIPLPRTAADVAALRQRRTWLSDQLVSAQGRRRDVASALERAHDPVNQNGLQGRLRVLDERIAQIETDIAATGRALTSAPTAAVVADAPRFSAPDFDRGPSTSVVAIVFIVCVLLPMTIALARILVRRSRVGAPDPLARESAARLARLEQAVDAIAVEVERVSEGQRFVTRLLAEGRAPAETAPALQAYRPD